MGLQNQCRMPQMQLLRRLEHRQTHNQNEANLPPLPPHLDHPKEQAPKKLPKMQLPLLAQAPQILSPAIFKPAQNHHPPKNPMPTMQPHLDYPHPQTPPSLPRLHQPPLVRTHFKQKDSKKEKERRSFYGRGHSPRSIGEAF